MANLEVLNGQPWAPNGAAMGQLKHPIRQVENVESQLVHRFRTLQFLIFTCFIVAGLRASGSKYGPYDLAAAVMPGERVRRYNAWNCAKLKT